VERLRVLHLPVGGVRALARRVRPPGRAARLAAAVFCAAAIAAATVIPTFAAWAGPPPSTELVVSFKHPGQDSELCRALSAEEKARLPVHMRRDRVCERGRVPV